MTREEFVEGYMTRNGLIPYAQDGETVKYTMENGETEILHALECKCGEGICCGWAMIFDGNQNYHRFQNELTDMSLEEALSADMSVRKVEKEFSHVRTK